MDIGKNMEKALNGQINRELHASYLYLSASAFLGSSGLPGLAGWMREHSEEERAHAMRIFDYVDSRGGKVALLALEEPKSAWKDALEAVKDAYDHELKVTKDIYALVDLARSEGDKASEAFLSWFVNEQVEEEEVTKAMVEDLAHASDHKHALLMLDRSLRRKQES